MKLKINILLTVVLGLLLHHPVEASEPVSRPDSLTYTDEYLDSVRVNRTLSLNDYPMIGIVYGGSMNRMSFNPPNKQKSVIIPEYFGVVFTKYSKMFKTMPYFGFQLGVFYGHEAYEFKEDEETHTIATIEGATKAVYDIIEVPFLMHGHYDFQHFKIIANIGLYGGYRFKIHRTGPYVAEELKENFKDTDLKLDYGLQGGLGFGIVFSPVELHINATVRYSWGSLYKPNYASEYYYKYAYPFDVMVTAGLHFQLGKRTGKTKKVLRQEAQRIVDERYKVEEINNLNGTNVINGGNIENKIEKTETTINVSENNEDR